MSTILQMLPVSLHTDNSKPIDNTYRLAILRWKKTDSNPKPHPAICIQVPVTSIVIEPAILEKSLSAQFQELQDIVLRSHVETSGIDTVLAAKAIPATICNPEAVAAFQEAETESKRLSKDSLEKWYDNYVSDNLLLTLANKAGFGTDPNYPITDDQLSTLNKTIAVTKTAIASLAGPRSSYPVNTINQLQKVIRLSTKEGSDDIATALNAKLTKMLEPVATIELDL